MATLTYSDIIDEKVAEWHEKLKNLEQQAARASSDSLSRSTAKMNELRTSIDSAVVQLRELDAQETVGNTMETKDKILQIFNSIDMEFKEFEDKTPFML